MSLPDRTISRPICSRQSYPLSSTGLANAPHVIVPVMRAPVSAVASMVKVPPPPCGVKRHAARAVRVALPLHLDRADAMHGRPEQHAEVEHVAAVADAPERQVGVALVVAVPRAPLRGRHVVQRAVRLRQARAARRYHVGCAADRAGRVEWPTADRDPGRAGRPPPRSIARSSMMRGVMPALRARAGREETSSTTETRNHKDARRSLMGINNTRSVRLRAVVSAVIDDRLNAPGRSRSGRPTGRRRGPGGSCR